MVNQYVLNNIRVYSNALLLLDIKNLVLHPNTTYFLLGNNSGGKSTLLHVLQDVLPHTLECKGVIQRPHYPSGILLQGARAGLNPHIMVKNMINELFKVYHFEYSYSELLERFELSKRVLTLYPFELSVGMSQRVMYVLTILSLLGKVSQRGIQPLLSHLVDCWILLDEPDSSLDMHSLNLIINFTFSFFANVVIVTHRMAQYTIDNPHYICVENGLLLYAGMATNLAILPETIIKNKVTSYIA